tara:strand:- start:1353 stop:2618 length:1266 start_codon:yes stop_codon:yes gene_type:complete
MQDSALKTGLPAYQATERFYWRQIEDVLIVIDLPVSEFTILNRTAGIIWLNLLDECWTKAGLINLVSDTSASDAHTPENDVTTLLENWAVLGWLETESAGNLCIPTTTMATPPPPYKTVSIAKLNSMVKRTSLEWSRTMDFIGQPIDVNFYCDPEHLNSDISIRANTFLNGLPIQTSTPDDCDRIHCYVTQNGVFLRLGDLCVEAKEVSDGLSRLTLWCFYQAYGRKNFLGTFHAAALGRDEGAILMPGLSGAGKSTLTAYLASNGWLYGGDDIIGLSKPQDTENDYLVLPFCSAVSVKSGSVDILSEFYPSLKTLPLIQYDTKSARFPSVPVVNQMTQDPTHRKIKAIVFPAFDKKSKTDLVPLTTEDALLALVGVGVRTGETMDAALLDNLFHFLETTPKYRLEFSSMDQAHKRLESIL